MEKINEQFKSIKQLLPFVIVNNLEINDFNKVEKKFISLKGSSCYNYKTYSLLCISFYKPVIKIIPDKSIANFKVE